MVNECCGMHVVQCAKVFSIIGFVLSILSLNFISAAIYGLVYYGIEYKQSVFLLPAIIILGIITFLIILIFLGFTGFAIFAISHVGKFGAFYFIGVAFIGIIGIFHIFSFIILNSARKCILESENTHRPPIPSTYVYPQTSANPQPNYAGQNYSPQTNPTYSSPQNYYPSTQIATAPPQYPDYPQHKF